MNIYQADSKIKTTFKSQNFFKHPEKTTSDKSNIKIIKKSNKQKIDLETNKISINQIKDILLKK